jgi:hypothetical protein
MSDTVMPENLAATRDDWLARIDAIGEDKGYFQTVGPRHWALFVDESPTLLVSFEMVDQIRARPGELPAAHGIAAKHGWSHLCLIADGPTWYRDPAVYGYFDRLVDDAFFEDFDRVLFYGAGMGGYAAAAYAVTAPGAAVLLVNPRATLDPKQASWDRRNLAARKLDFTSRYGYGPDMIEGAGKVFVLHDPTSPVDAMHAALFHAPYVTPLKAPLLADRLDWALAHMGVLDTLIEAAIEDRLTPALWASVWRRRRDFGPYLRAILQRSADAGRTSLEAMICRSVNSRLNAPRFRKRLAELTAAQ